MFTLKASQNEAGSCERFFTNELYNSTFKNLFIEWQFKSIDWEQRGMPIKDYYFEYNSQRKPDFGSYDIYNVYSEQLIQRDILNASCSLT